MCFSRCPHARGHARLQLYVFLCHDICVLTHTRREHAANAFERNAFTNACTHNRQLANTVEHATDDAQAVTCTAHTCYTPARDCFIYIYIYTHVHVLVHVRAWALAYTHIMLAQALTHNRFSLPAQLRKQRTALERWPEHRWRVPVCACARTSMYASVSM